MSGLVISTNGDCLVGIFYCNKVSGIWKLRDTNKIFFWLDQIAIVGIWDQHLKHAYGRQTYICHVERFFLLNHLSPRPFAKFTAKTVWPHHVQKTVPDTRQSCLIHDASYSALKIDSTEKVINIKLVGIIEAHKFAFLRHLHLGSYATSKATRLVS